METLFATIRKFAPAFLRISLGIILLWIGALKFVDPSPVVGLLQASLPFLASPAFVYLLGVLEVVAAVLLFARFRVQYVGLLVFALFLGTLTIFLIAPGVVYGDRSFPVLSLVGEFLLKDLVLSAATLAVIAMESERGGARQSTLPSGAMQPR